MNINQNRKIDYPEPGNVVNIFGDLYLVTERVKDQFIDVVRLRDGFLHVVETGIKYLIVDGEFVAKS